MGEGRMPEAPTPEEVAIMESIREYRDAPAASASLPPDRDHGGTPGWRERLAAKCAPIVNPEFADAAVVEVRAADLRAALAASSPACDCDKPADPPDIPHRPWCASVTGFHAAPAGVQVDREALRDRVIAWFADDLTYDRYKGWTDERLADSLLAALAHGTVALVAVVEDRELWRERAFRAARLAMEPEEATNAHRLDCPYVQDQQGPCLCGAAVTRPAPAPESPAGEPK